MEPETLPGLVIFHSVAWSMNVMNSLHFIFQSTNEKYWISVLTTHFYFDYEPVIISLCKRVLASVIHNVFCTVFSKVICQNVKSETGKTLT